MKKIFGTFLFLFLLGLSVGIYFYFSPIYPNYGISEEYFNTVHYDKDTYSDKNGKTILLGLSQIDGENNVLGYYLQAISDLENKEYITKLDSENAGGVLEKLKSINKVIVNTEDLYSYTVFLIGILNKLDSNLVESIVLMDMIYKNTILLSENTQQALPSLRNKIIENAIKHEYHYISSGVLGELDNISTFKSKLFYNKEETKNLLSKQFQSSVLRQNIPRFKINGHNYIGRILINTSVVSYLEYFEREEELKQHINNYNILLSN